MSVKKKSGAAFDQPRPGARSADRGSVFKEAVSKLKVINSREPQLVEAFVRAVNAGPTGASSLEADLWGQAPSRDEQRAVELTQMQRQFVLRNSLIASSLTRAEVAGLLGVTEQTITDRLEAGDLVGLRQGREWRIPAWQFNAETERGFLPGVRRVHTRFPGGVVSLSMWMTAPNVELNGDTPAQALLHGQVDEVVRISSIGTAAAW